MSNPAIQVKHLSRSFGPARAVNDVSFDIEAGHVVGFIGANGAGKTTTMRIMSTLEQADEGSVTIHGYDVADQPFEVRRLLGWMPDHFGRYTHMDVLEYLDFFARAYRLRGAERASRLEEVLHFTDLSQLSSRPVSHLSKGQSQRLSLARTLLNDPRVLILDEPAAGLDPKARIELKNLIRLLSDQGKTIFISSHILSELDEICSSLLFIDDGEIVYHGDSAQLKRGSSDQALLEVTLLGDPTPLHAWIESHPELQLDRQQGDRCFFQLAKPDPQRQAAILKSMVESGFPILSFQASEQRLEDAFVQRLQAKLAPPPNLPKVSN